MVGFRPLNCLKGYPGKEKHKLAGGILVLKVHFFFHSDEIKLEGMVLNYSQVSTNSWIVGEHISSIWNKFMNSDWQIYPKLGRWVKKKILWGWLKGISEIPNLWSPWWIKDPLMGWDQAGATTNQKAWKNGTPNKSILRPKRVKTDTQKVIKSNWFVCK